MAGEQPKPPTTSTVPFSDIVNAVDPEPEDATDYVFSNGRRFKRDRQG